MLFLGLKNRTRMAAGCIVLTGTTFFAPQLRAQEKPADKPAPAGDAAKAPVDAPRPKAIPGLQPGDDVVEPLTPKTPRTVAEDNKIKAAALFAVGKIFEAKNDHQAALKAYKQAVALDPQAIEVYRSLIALAEALNQPEESAHWAEKLVEIDATDFRLLIQLGQLRIERRDVAGAAKHWEAALKLPKVREEQVLYLGLLRQLTGCYAILNQKEDAARCMEILFVALQDPEKKIPLALRTQLLGKDPGATIEEMGTYFLDTKRSELAVRAFKAAAELKKGGSGNLEFNLARVYLQTDKPDQALEQLQKYFDDQRQTKGRAAYELLADILKKQNKGDEVLARISELAEKDPRNSDLQYYLADQYLAAKKFEDAERVYRKTILFDATPEGYRGLAECYRQQDRPQDLLDVLGKAYSKAEEIDPIEVEIKAISADKKLVQSLLDFGMKAKSAGQLDFGGSLVLANILSEATMNPEAVEYFTYALSLRKHKDAYFGLSQTLLEMRKYAEAIKVLEEAADDRGSDTRANFLYSLSRARELNGDTDGALEAVKDAKRILSDDHPMLAYQEAWIYYHAQKYDEAIPRFEKLIASLQNGQAQATLRQAQFSLSNIHVLQGNIRKGEEILEGVLKESPDDPSVNNDLGYLYADQGKNLEQAEKMIAKALAAEPENTAYLDSMGWVLFKLGKIDQAIPLIEKACEKSVGGSDETLLDHLGDVYDKAQQPAKALEAWKKGLKSAKESPRPDQKLIQKLEEKIKGREADSGKLKPASDKTP